MVHLLQLMTLWGHVTITQRPPSISGLTLAVGLDKCTSWIHHYSVTHGIFSSLNTLWALPVPPPHPHNCIHSCVFSGRNRAGIPESAAFSRWLLSHRNTHFRFLHDFSPCDGSFFFGAAITFYCLDGPQFIQSPTEGHLAAFVLAIRSETAISICVQVSVWT